MALEGTEKIYQLKLIVRDYIDPYSWNAEYYASTLGFYIGESGSSVLGSRGSHISSGVKDNYISIGFNPPEEWSIYGSKYTSNNIIYGGSGNRMYGDSLKNNSIIGGNSNKIISGSENYIFGVGNEVKNHLKSKDGNLLFGVENKIYGKENTIFGYQNYIGNINTGHNNIMILNGKANSTFSKNPSKYILNDVYKDSFYQTYSKITGAFLSSHSFLTILNGTCNFIGGEFSAIANGSYNNTIGSFTNFVNGSGNDFTTDYSFGGNLTCSRIGGKNIFIANSTCSFTNYLDQELIRFNSNVFQYEGKNLILDGDQSLISDQNQKWIHSQDRRFDLKIGEDKIISNNFLYNSSFNNSSVCSSGNYNSLIINGNTSQFKNNAYLTSFNLRSGPSVFGSSCHNAFLFIDEDGESVSGSFSTSIGSRNFASKSNYTTSFGGNNRMMLNSGILALGSNINLNSGLSGVAIFQQFKNKLSTSISNTSILVSGAGTPYVNRRYVPMGVLNGKIWYSGLALQGEQYTIVRNGDLINLPPLNEDELLPVIYPIDYINKIKITLYFTSNTMTIQEANTKFRLMYQSQITPLLAPLSDIEGDTSLTFFILPQYQEQLSSIIDSASSNIFFGEQVFQNSLTVGGAAAGSPAVHHSIFWNGSQWQVGNDVDDYYYSTINTSTPYSESAFYLPTGPGAAQFPAPTVNIVYKPITDYPIEVQGLIKKQNIQLQLKASEIPSFYDVDIPRPNKSNSMVMNFENGIFIDSISGLYLNGKNFRRNLKASKAETQLSGLFV